LVNSKTYRFLSEVVVNSLHGIGPHHCNVHAFLVITVNPGRVYLRSNEVGYFVSYLHPQYQFILELFRQREHESSKPAAEVEDRWSNVCHRWVDLLSVSDGMFGS
jgi:hypothetical protein